MKGHQDGNEIIALPQDTWLNIEADIIAKEKLNPG